MSAPLTLDVLQTAYLLKTGRDATYNALARGELPAIRVGRQWRVLAHRLATEVLGCTMHDIVVALAEKDRVPPSGFQLEDL